MMNAQQFHNYVTKLREAHPQEAVEYDVEEFIGDDKHWQAATITVDGKYEQCVQIEPPVVDRA